MASPPCVCLLILLAIFGTCRSRSLVDDVAVSDEMSLHLQPSVTSCSTDGNYSNGSQYNVSLDRLLSAIPMAAANNGFFNGKFGVAGNEVFSLFMCYAGDTDPHPRTCGYHEAVPT
ncbi:hypothetical protein ACQ4PT_026560 [Festuca glaucescens]